MAGHKKNLPVLNKREKKFVKNYIKDPKVCQAAREAGYPHPNYGSVLLSKPKIQQAILMELERQGITDEKIVAKIREGLEATLPERRSPKGVVVQEEHPDYYVRSLYLDKVLKIRGDYAPEKREEVSKSLTVVIDADMIKALIDAGAIAPHEVLELTKNDQSGKAIEGKKD